MFGEGGNQLVVAANCQHEGEIALGKTLLSILALEYLVEVEDSTSRVEKFSDPITAFISVSPRAFRKRSKYPAGMGVTWLPENTPISKFRLPRTSVPGLAASTQALSRSSRVWKMILSAPMCWAMWRP